MVTVKKSNINSYYDKIKKIPLLSFEDEIALSRLVMQGNEEARNKIIEANLRLVVKISKSYCCEGISQLDIIQEGNMGLMKAAEKYDYRKKVRFSTYAGWWIRQAMSRYILNKKRVIRLSPGKEETFRKIQNAFNVLSQKNMRRPLNTEIAAEIGETVEEVDHILSLTNKLLPIGTDNGFDEDTIPASNQDNYAYAPERTMMDQSLRDITKRVLRHLQERERKIIIYHFQLNGMERYTLKNIGDMMGISTETVRQIELRALNKIRSNAEELRIYYGQ